MITYTNEDCMIGMAKMGDSSVDFTLTDIPYAAVNRQSNGLRSMDKEAADVMRFDLDLFLHEVLRVTKNSICMFCGKEQFSKIYEFFAGQAGTVRPIIWEKSNPSPMNGQFIYLSGVEMAVWFKKKGAKTFNAHCRNTVFKYPNGKREIHPTQKNIELFKQLIVENTNANDTVFDPCAGSATSLLAAKILNRNAKGFEIDADYYKASSQRLDETQQLCYWQTEFSDRPDYARP